MNKCHYPTVWFSKKSTLNIKTLITKIISTEKIYHANIKAKKARVTVSAASKVDLKARNIIRDKEEHFRMIKKSVD